MSQINNEFHIPINKEMSTEAQTIAKMLFASSEESENINFSHPHSLEIFRRMMDKNLKELLDKITVDYQLERVSIDGIRAVWISTPQIKEDKKVILYLHGGCYVSGNIEIYSTIPIQLAHSSQIKILSIDYSLAPENPFPNGLNDLVKVFHYLCNHGYSANNIGILGDSAGGGLALSMLLKLKEMNAKLPAALGLLSPWADLSFSGETFNTLAGVDPILSQEQLSVFANMYVQKEDVKNPFISSVYGDYKDFPPMMIIAGSHEILLSDSTRIAQNAMNQKVEVSLDIFNGLWHVFCADPTLPESKNAIKKLSSFFNKNLF